MKSRISKRKPLQSRVQGGRRRSSNSASRKGRTEPAEEMFEAVNAGWMDLGVEGAEHVAGTTSARRSGASPSHAVQQQANGMPTFRLPNERKPIGFCTGTTCRVNRPSPKLRKEIAIRRAFWPRTPKPDVPKAAAATLLRDPQNGGESLVGSGLERAKGFEPSTPTLARLCSTPELRPRSRTGRGF